MSPCTWHPAWICCNWEELALLLSHPAALPRFYLGKEARSSLGVVYRAPSAWQRWFSCPEHVLHPSTLPAGSVLMELSPIGDASDQEVLTLAKCAPGICIEPSWQAVPGLTLWLCGNLSDKFAALSSSGGFFPL